MDLRNYPGEPDYLEPTHDHANGKATLPPQGNDVSDSSAPARSYEDYLEEIDLQRYWLILKRRWLIVVGTGVFCLAPATLFAWWLTQLPQDYVAVGQLLFQKHNPKSELTGLGEQVGALDSVAGDPLTTESLILQSNSLVQEAIESLGDQAPKIPVNKLKEKLVVEKPERSDILIISYSSPDPQFSVSLVNALMKIYIENNDQLTLTEVSAAQEFIKGQLPQLENNVNVATEALRQFKLEHQIISLEEETKVVAERITSINSQIEDLRTQVTSAQAKSAELGRRLNMNPQQALDLTAATQSPGVQEILKNLQDLQTQLVQQRTLYTPDHPVIANLNRQIAAVEALLQTRISEVIKRSSDPFTLGDLQMGTMEQGLANDLLESEINRTILSSQLDSMIQLRGIYADRSRSLPDLEKKERELELNLLIAQDSYQKLLSRLPELVIAQSQSIGNSQVQIIEEASLLPTPPNGLNIKYIAAGGIAGFAVGISLALFLELADRSVKTMKDAEVLLGYSLFGAIPEFKTAEDKGTGDLVSDEVSRRVVVHRSPNSPICESYQMVQAKLKFTAFDHPGQSLLITSTAAQEGRSEIAANLAATLAQTKRKILLIDADLRSPTQHLLWKRRNDRGFSDLLRGEPDIFSVLQTIAPNFYLLTSGSLPSNPLALLDSDETARILKSLAKEFDQILLDTPPLMQAADAAILGEAVNYALFVLRPRFGDPNTILDAKKTLEKSNAKVLGFVANYVDFNQEHQGHAHYARKHKDAETSEFLSFFGQDEEDNTNDRDNNSDNNPDNNPDKNNKNDSVDLSEILSA
jgi:capsular exopolysaccharide synthesis family protein